MMKMNTMMKMMKTKTTKITNNSKPNKGFGYRIIYKAFTPNDIYLVKYVPTFKEIEDLAFELVKGLHKGDRLDLVYDDKVFTSTYEDDYTRFWFKVGDALQAMKRLSIEAN